MFNLPDNSAEFFGRGALVQTLIDRVYRKGVTALVGRPQIGKSWLLKEVARQLAAGHKDKHLVGFAVSTGQLTDLAIRATADLYERWLTDAGYWKQARMVLKQQKRNLLPAFAQTMGAVAKEAPLFGKPAGVAISRAFDGLVRANQTLLTGGLELPTLQQEQVRDLLNSVFQVSKLSPVLFLDGWEQSPDPSLSSRVLDAFLQDLEGWPQCHIFVGLRPGTKAEQVIDELARLRPEFSPEDRS